MLVVAACLLALASPLVAGRWPRGALLRRWRAPWLVWLALAAQVVTTESGLTGRAAPLAHVATYAVAAAFVVLNRRAPGLLVVGAGAACNGVTIALNGGTLPADPDAVRRAGLADDGGFTNSGVLADPVLPWLGDVAAWPAPLPLANVFSVGDVLVVAGVAVAAWRGSTAFRGESRVVAAAAPQARGG